MKFILFIIVVAMCGCSNLITVRDSKNNLIECDCSQDYVVGHPCADAVKKYREQHRYTRPDRNNQRF